MSEPGEWKRVTRREPCPVCGHGDYCTRRTNGKSVRCMRVESLKPAGGQLGGWFHDFEEALPVAPEKQAKPPAPRIEDVAGLAHRMFARPEAERARLDLAERWNVRPRVLERLMVGVSWSERGEQFLTFPSVDGYGKIVGIVRRFADGKKLTYPGTSNGGLFVPQGWEECGGSVLVVEGASDVAALAQEGFCVVGRPSNLGGIQPLKTLLAGVQRRVIVIGENDRKADRAGHGPGCLPGCPGCNWCFPGRFGAAHVAQALGCGYLMPPDGVKDVRDWRQAAGQDFAGDVVLWLAQAGQSQHLNT